MWHSAKAMFNTAARPAAPAAKPPPAADSSKMPAAVPPAPDDPGSLNDRVRALARAACKLDAAFDIAVVCIKNTIWRRAAPIGSGFESTARLIETEPGTFRLDFAAALGLHRHAPMWSERGGPFGRVHTNDVFSDGELCAQAMRAAVAEVDGGAAVSWYQDGARCVVVVSDAHQLAALARLRGLAAALVVAQVHNQQLPAAARRWDASMWVVRGLVAALSRLDLDPPGLKVCTPLFNWNLRLLNVASWYSRGALRASKRPGGFAYDALVLLKDMADLEPDQVDRPLVAWFIEAAFDGDFSVPVEAGANALRFVIRPAGAPDDEAPADAPDVPNKTPADAPDGAPADAPKASAADE